MTDMRKTWWLRVALLALIVLTVMIVTALIDAVMSRFYEKVFGVKNDGFIEGVVFFVLILNRAWDWLCRRVWIGAERDPRP